MFHCDKFTCYVLWIFVKLLNMSLERALSALDALERRVHTLWQNLENSNTILKNQMEILWELNEDSMIQMTMLTMLNVVFEIFESDLNDVFDNFWRDARNRFWLALIMKWQ